MLIANDKPIVLIGYAQSTVTQEANHFISADRPGKVKIITPTEFLNLTDKQQYQYFVGFTLDIDLRNQIINLIEEENLDCIRYVHDTVVYYNPDINSWLGRGSFIAPYSTILLHAKIGKHCIIETYCLVAHYSELKDNIILHVGTHIAGKTTLGGNSIWNFRSAALNGLDICGNIEVGATSTVTKSLTQSGHYVGTPARRIGDRKALTHV
jgi:carbonic anhydrase/acetyltransferase-like protein (isoleucine patch superfamily)